MKILRLNISQALLKLNKYSEVIDQASKVLKDDPQIFYTFTRGVHESNVLITSSLKQHIEESYKDEICTTVQDNLSAITIGLPKENTKIAGLYYQFFKRLAWEGISLYEVVSTTNEFTILVEDEVVDTNIEENDIFFDENGYAFVLKPEKLRYIPITIPLPPPQNPELSYATDYSR